MSVRRGWSRGRGCTEQKTCRAVRPPVRPSFSLAIQVRGGIVVISRFTCHVEDSAMISRRAFPLAFTLVLGLAFGASADAACCYFSAKNMDVLQPAQKVFITWDPEEKVETFTVQPKFEGNALDFGMVIPTPSRPKLHEMPRDFFKHLAVYSIMKKREYPESKLLPTPILLGAGRGGLQVWNGANVDFAKAKKPSV